MELEILIFSPPHWSFALALWEIPFDAQWGRWAQDGSAVEGAAVNGDLLGSFGMVYSVYSMIFSLPYTNMYK